MRILFQNQWLKWGSVFLLAALVLAGTYYYQIQSLGKVQAAYTISNSARFISGNSDYLSRTPGSAGNQRTWTWSGWVKRGTLSTDQVLFGAASDNSNRTLIGFTTTDDQIQLYSILSGGNQARKYTAPVLRDPAKWYHIVVAVDTTQATAANRSRFYVDGVEVTSFPTNSEFALNDSTRINSTIAHNVGRNGGSVPSLYLDAYLSDVYLIDGAQLAPTCFGETDSNGYWRPKTYSTASPCAAYGTNGFHLAFGNGSALGTDSAGSNNFATSTNMTAAVSQLTDSPTNSFATLSPINRAAGVTQTTLSQGNLRASNAAASWTGALATQEFPKTGKWYTEITLNAAPPYLAIGLAISQTTNSQSIDAGLYLNSAAGIWYNTQSATGPATSAAGGMGNWTTGDVLNIAYDTDNGKIWFGRNNTYYSSGDPSAGTGATFSGTAITSKDWQVGVGTYTADAQVNFGQGGQSGLTYDSASGGTFKYTPPSGYKALSTNTLPAPTIAVPKNYFDAYAYTGTGAATSSTHFAFSPSLVWIKNRTDVASHAIFDSVRGVQKFFSSNASTAEDTDDTQSLSAFGSAGFSLGSGASTADVNTSAKNYISWVWKESPTSGFDIVTYTGTGVAKTEVHALSSAPEMIIVKDRTAASTNDWAVYHAANTSAPETDYLLLNSTAATADDATYWNDPAPTASVFSVGTNADVNTNTNSYVAYLFDQVDGFSKFGSYTGNAAADGPFIYTGFKPRYVMIKSSTAADAWLVYDTARNTYNVAGTTLVPNTTAADATISGIDFLSNGFKLRTITTTPNAAQTYIYAAFAEQPFYYSAQAAASAVITSAVTFLMGMTF